MLLYPRFHSARRRRIKSGAVDPTIGRLMGRIYIRIHQIGRLVLHGSQRPVRACINREKLGGLDLQDGGHLPVASQNPERRVGKFGVVATGSDQTVAAVDPEAVARNCLRIPGTDTRRSRLSLYTSLIQCEQRVIRLRRQTMAQPLLDRQIQTFIAGRPAVVRSAQCRRSTALCAGFWRDKMRRLC